MGPARTEPIAMRRYRAAREGARAVTDAEARSMLVTNSALGVREGALKNCSIYVVGTLGVFRDKVIKKITNFRCSNSQQGIRIP